MSKGREVTKNSIHLANTALSPSPVAFMPRPEVRSGDSHACLRGIGFNPRQKKSSIYETETDFITFMQILSNSISVMPSGFINVI